MRWWDRAELYVWTFLAGAICQEWLLPWIVRSLTR